MRRLLCLVCVTAACLLVCDQVFGEGAKPATQPVVIIPRTAPTKAKMVGAPKEPQALPFFVYNNAAVPSVKNFAPSGYMGDVGDLKVMGGYTNLHQQGYPCLRIVYMAGGDMGWVGLLWQNPANNWGDLDGGYNLAKAKRLSFWARGDAGGEIVEFKLGGIASKYPDSDSVSTGDVKLSPEWTQYTLDLSAANLNYISAGFGFVTKQDSNPNGCTFYLDDIRYEE